MRSRRSAHRAGVDHHRVPARRQPGPEAPRERRARRLPTAFWRRALAILLANLEVVLLGWVLLGPVFTVREVTVSGLRHVTRAEVLGLSGLDRPASMLILDGASIRRKLGSSTWIRTSTVAPVLPDRVEIAIDEWHPVAVYRAGDAGRTFYLSEVAAAIAPGQPAAGLADIHGPAGADPKPGEHPLEAQLLSALIKIQVALPSIYGQAVARYDLDCLGSLSLTTTRGVKLYFGRVLTPEEFVSLGDKLAALKSLAADAEVQKGEIEYINLVNPFAPAVKFKGAPAPTTPSPSKAAKTPKSPAPQPSPSPSPVAPAVAVCK